MNETKINAMFFIIMTAVTLGAYYYTTLRLWQMIPAGSIVRPLLVVFVVAALFSFIMGNIGIKALPVGLNSALYRFGSTWFFTAIYLLFIFILLDIVRATNLTNLSNYMEQSWVGFGTLAVAMVLLMGSGYIIYKNKKRSEITITLDKPIEGGAMKILFLSDLHLGYGIGKSEFKGWVELINREQPDIVLLGGDVIDNDVHPLFEDNFAEAFKLIDSKYGVYAVLGNHEYISGVDKSLSFLEEAGVTTLRDSVATIGGVLFVGRDDLYSRRRRALSQVVEGYDRGLPTVMMDHQPMKLSDAEECGIDLQLSGHTHRGQIFPINLITDAIFEVSHGYRQKGSTHYYISSGMGVWGGKFRIGSRSEYVVINLIER